MHNRTVLLTPVHLFPPNPRAISPASQPVACLYIYTPHETVLPEQHQTSRPQHAAWGHLLSCSSPSPAVLLYIFLKLDSAPRQSYCCIYMHNPQASSTVMALPAAWPSELRTRAPLVRHSYSCTTLYSCTSHAPLRTLALPVHHSVLLHFPCTTPYLCTHLVHHSVLVHNSYSCTTRTRAPLMHHSVLLLLSCTTPYSCTSRVRVQLVQQCQLRGGLIISHNHC